MPQSRVWLPSPPDTSPAAFSHLHWSPADDQPLKQDQNLPLSLQLLPVQSQGTAGVTHVQLWNTLLVKEGLEKGARPTV